MVKQLLSKTIASNTTLATSKTQIYEKLKLESGLSIGTQNNVINALS